MPSSFPPEIFDDAAYVGRPYQEVVDELKRLETALHVHEVATDMFVTADFKVNRIRVWYFRDTGLVESVRRG